MRLRSAVWVVIFALAACTSAYRAVPAPDSASTPAAPNPRTTGPPASSTATTMPPSNASGTVAPAKTPYERSIDAAAARSLEVWVEGDLLKRWRTGPTEFDAGVRQLAALASRPGVVGIKIADELGYRDGFGTDPQAVLDFLHASAAALRAAAPGRLVLIDLLVPELGCLPGSPGAGPAQCAADARTRWPALTLDAVDRLMASRDVDVVNLSTGLIDDTTYSQWGSDVESAQKAAFAEVARRGWAHEVRLNFRRALAHPGSYDKTGADTDRDMVTFVDLPEAAGAQTIDIWTWRQLYHGDVVRLLDPGLRDNALWDALQRRRQEGIRLSTHFTPSSVETTMDGDLDRLSQVFQVVFVAAGIG